LAQGLVARAGVGRPGLGHRLLLRSEDHPVVDARHDALCAGGGDLGSDVEDDESVDPVGMGGREEVGVVAAHRQAHQDDPVQAERVEEAEDISDHQPAAVFGRPVGVAVTALVERQDPVPVVEGSGRVVPRVGVAAEPVEHHQRRGVPAPVEVVERQTVEVDLPRSGHRGGHGSPLASGSVPGALRTGGTLPGP
jgi:hypothetical protein